MPDRLSASWHSFPHGGVYPPPIPPFASPRQVLWQEISQEDLVRQPSLPPIASSIWPFASHRLVARRFDTYVDSRLYRLGISLLLIWRACQGRKSIA